MNKTQLMKFIQQIMEMGSSAKAQSSLNELKRILTQQLASEEVLHIIQIAVDCVPELKEESEKGYLTDQDLEHAQVRAKARREREEAARAYGRC